MADSTEALEDKMPGLSQTDCLAGKGSEGDSLPVCEVRVKLGVSTAYVISHKLDFHYNI